MTSGATVLGRREQSKLDKRRRIGEAARAVFTEFGYARANMREIAKRAGVATGTLFLYAPDKRNLLLWILNDDLDALTHESFATLDRDFAGGAFLDRLMLAWEARYRYWGADPDLALHALQELIVTRDVQSTSAISPDDAYQARRLALFELVTNVVRTHQERGELDDALESEMIARLVMAIYNAAVRTWLRSGTQPDIDQGLADLRALLDLAIQGCIKTTARGAAGTSG